MKTITRLTLTLALLGVSSSFMFAQTPTPGMARRQDRREDAGQRSEQRQDKRQDRREDAGERVEQRQDQRQERREDPLAVRGQDRREDRREVRTDRKTDRRERVY